MALTDCRTALRNTYSYLEDNGLFRFVLPDLERLALDYVKSEDPGAALVFMERTYLGIKTRQRGLKSLLRRHFGNSSHLWMWDFKAMMVELTDAGFRNVRRAVFGDSRDRHFDDVETQSRWEGCLGVECTK